MIAASVADFREMARRRLPRLCFDYVDGGSYAEQTMRRNVQDLGEIVLRQRVLRDVSKLSMKTTLFGQEWSMPVGLGPVGFAGMFARRGEVQAARAAERAKVPICLSTLSICSLEEVNRAVSVPIWFQLYMIKDRGFMAELLAHVAEQRTPVLVLTVDLPVAGARYRDVRSGMSAPPGFATGLKRAWQGITHPAWLWDVQIRGAPITFGNLESVASKARGVGQFSAWIAANFDPSVTWKDIEWVRARWNGPLVIKGVLDAQDARTAIDAGADGIVVSNHGGRQLDGALSGIGAMPRIVDAVGGRTPLLMDGGVRSGLDVLRALAVGARGCLIGRAWAYALGAQGGYGVRRALSIIRAELAVAMALTGCVDVLEANPDMLT